MDFPIEEMLGKRQHYKTGFHKKPLLIAWLPLVNFAILFAAMRWYKYSFYLHVLFATAVIILTLFSTIHILQDAWLSPDDHIFIQKIHNYAGLIIVIWLGVQVVTGIASRLVQALPNVSTNTCLFIKRIHVISSYLLLIGAKFDYLNIKVMKEEYVEFAQWLVIELIFLALYLWLKFSYWTLSEDIVDEQLRRHTSVKDESKLGEILRRIKQRFMRIKAQVRQKELILPQLLNQINVIQSEDEITIKDYFLFNDMVYDSSKLKYLHPGGQSIINLMNKKQLNRYMYGCYKPEHDHSLKLHNHTKESLRLCGDPIARIERICPVDGFDDLTKFKIFIMRPLRGNSNVWALYLKPIFKRHSDGQRLNFVGYTDENQFGQHVTLTICNSKGRKRITRLYTTIWSMRECSLYFLKKLMPESQIDVIFTKKTLRQPRPAIQGISDSLLSAAQIQNESVPLVVKKYQLGQLTSRLIVDDFQGQIVISKPMGEGMRYHELPDHGKVIFVCGGTGVLPFCDFIDMLFKQVKILEGTRYQETIQRQDPVVKKDLIKNRKFVIYFAVESSDDMVPVTVHQLDHLSRSEKISFEVNMKIKHEEQRMKNLFRKFKYQSCSFDLQIESSLTDDLSKIYVCGPSKMNSAMSKIFKTHNLEEQKFLFL